MRRAIARAIGQPMKIVTTIASDMPTIGTTSLGIMLSGFHGCPSFDPALSIAS